jgi:hypothetical protein
MREDQRSNYYDDFPYSYNNTLLSISSSTTITEYGGKLDCDDGLHFHAIKGPMSYSAVME